VTERDDGFSEAVVHRPAMPAGIKGRPYACWSRDRIGAADPEPLLAVPIFRWLKADAETVRGLVLPKLAST
jgi:hypothetical protein